MDRYLDRIAYVHTHYWTEESSLTGIKLFVGYFVLIFFNSCYNFYIFYPPVCLSSKSKETHFKGGVIVTNRRID